MNGTHPYMHTNAFAHVRTHTHPKLKHSLDETHVRFVSILLKLPVRLTGMTTWQ